jgi:hypothetical protein
MARCFQVHIDDNVATLMEDGAAGVVELVGPAPGSLEARTAISLGHKVALREIAAGAAVLKYGVRIGTATAAIERGEWVHIHNCRSDYDDHPRAMEARHE